MSITKHQCNVKSFGASQIYQLTCKSKFVCLRLLLLIISLSLFSACTTSSSYQQLSTAQAIDQIKAGDVEEIVISDTSVELISDSGQRYRIVNAPTLRFTEWLSEQGVSEEQIAEIKFTLSSTSDSANSSFLAFISMTPIWVLIAWAALACVALVYLGKRSLPNYARIVWALIILGIPILGAVAFLLSAPNSNS